MTSGCEAVIMHFVGWNVMTVCPVPVGWTKASIAAPLLHRIRKDVLHALVAVKLDDLFYRAVLQVHPVEIFPDENIDSARTGAVFPKALAPFFNLSALHCVFCRIRIKRDLTLHRRRPHMNRGPA